MRMNKIQLHAYRVIKETVNSTKCLVDVKHFSVARSLAQHDWVGKLLLLRS